MTRNRSAHCTCRPAGVVASGRIVDKREVGPPICAHTSSVVAKGRTVPPQVLVRRSEIFRLDAHFVIDCYAQSLLAAEVPLRCLDRDVSEQELNLIEFAAGEVTSLAQLRLRSCGASFSMEAREAASRTISHSTFGVIPVPHTRPVLLMDRNSAPSARPAAFFHSSIAAFTHAGIGPVRICPALPSRSAITQCSSRNWMELTRNASSSPRRNPHPISIASMA